MQNRKKSLVQIVWFRIITISRYAEPEIFFVSVFHIIAIEIFYCYTAEYNSGTTSWPELFNYTYLAKFRKYELLSYYSFKQTLEIDSEPETHCHYSKSRINSTHRKYCHDRFFSKKKKKLIFSKAIYSEISFNDFSIMVARVLEKVSTFQGEIMFMLRKPSSRIDCRDGSPSTHFHLRWLTLFVKAHNTVIEKLNFLTP